MHAYCHNAKTKTTMKTQTKSENSFKRANTRSKLVHTPAGTAARGSGSVGALDFTSTLRPSSVVVCSTSGTRGGCVGIFRDDNRSMNSSKLRQQEGKTTVPLVSSQRFGFRDATKDEKHGKHTSNKPTKCSKGLGISSQTESSTLLLHSRKRHKQRL